jgi:hypothetical protein
MLFGLFHQRLFDVLFPLDEPFKVPELKIRIQSGRTDGIQAQMKTMLSSILL